ncbi:hypothetical protein MN116_006502 [Schistosoma mekongi]|uniref:Glycosyl hydrolase family 13 catalytic domain-containing protein n=1 Tax=Schistosoma mekongi TaxID=38744 RepID=A0AAE1ZBH5_SCHME|nr:hypothetical protein MN116_006502 [Schistosoma mekongi]
MSQVVIHFDYVQNEAETNLKKSNETVNRKQDSTDCSSIPSTDKCESESYILTRQDLIELDRNEPNWKYIRRVLLIGLVIIFFGLLISCIVYVIVGKKCPYKPMLPFWKSTVGYWLDVFAFKDSSGDFIGDLNGLTSELDYIKSVVRAGYIILGPITKGFYNNSHNILALVEDYEQLDEFVGTMEDFRLLLKQSHKKGLKVVLTFDFNSVSINHKWIAEKNVKLMKLPNDSHNMVSRYNQPLNVEIDGHQYYSVFGSPNVDLDLTDSNTKKAVFKVIDYWMKEGIDGILLENSAFFVEDRATLPKRNINWLDNCPNSQLYSNGSVKFVADIRREVDKWTVETGERKLLAVTPGDTGCGVGDTSDPMLMFRDVADVIISREFTFQKGSKQSTKSGASNDIYATYSDTDKQKFGMTTSTSNMPPNGDIITVASTLLLPGAPIIYYGTEIGVDRTKSTTIPKNIYPNGRNYNNEPLNRFSSILSHLPMPWDVNGTKYSAAINDSRFRDYLLESEQVSAVVDVQLADENDNVTLQLVRKLISLRQNPAFQWGTFEMIKIDEGDRGIIEGFIRKTTSFPSFVIVFLNVLGVCFFDLTSVCSSVTPRLVYPSVENLPVDKPMSTTKIHLKFEKRITHLIVFECT